MKSTRPARHRSKTDWIAGLIHARDVLYVGSVDDDPGNLAKHRVHQASLQTLTRSLVGVYKSDAHAALVREGGCQALRANVEELELGRTFDVIVAVDNLEHIDNCGRFLDGMARHLGPRGVLLVSTPNPTSLVRILEILIHGKTKANLQHTAWYTAQVLDQLARRHGLHVAAEAFIDEMREYHRTGPSARRMGVGKSLMTWLVVALNGLVCPVLPQLSETFGFVLVKLDDRGVG